jgi:glycine/betaine/sarcosine/D-proline reductase family selenoprotein B
MAKEIERAGIPCPLISALFSLALTTGAPRVIRGARIEHVCGDPRLGPEKDREYGIRIVRTALRAIQTAVSEPTLFDPSDLRPVKEGTVAA